MHGKLSDKSVSNEGEMTEWREKPFASGHDIQARPASVNFWKIFLLLIAIHTSIFIVSWNPLAGGILLLALIRGWMNGI